MSKSKRIKGRKSDQEQTYWQAYYRAHADKYRAWSKAWRERKKAEREAAQAAEKTTAGKGRK